MIYILNEKQETIGVASNSNPLALPYYNDIHTENLEGVNTYEFVVPNDHEEASKLKAEGHVIIKNLDGDNLLFTIKEVSEGSDSGKAVRRVFCEETAVGELLTDIMRPQTFASTTLEALVDTILSNSPDWRVNNIPYTESKEVKFDDYSTVLEALYKAIGEWGYEMFFTVDLRGTEIVKKKVNVVEQRGNDARIRFDYSYDLRGVSRTENSQNVVTALIGVGKGDNSSTRVSLSGLSAFDDGDIYKEVGSDWIGSESALQRYGKNGRHRYAVYVDDKATNLTELKRSTIRELKKRIKPEVHYSCSISTLERLSGYEGKAVRVGDTIVASDYSYGEPMVIEGRVNQLKRSYTRIDNDEVDLGSYKRVSVSPNKAILDLQKTISLNEEKWKVTGTTIEIQSLNGNTFKNGSGSTTLTAKAFQAGLEVDADGQMYTYKWFKFDSQGNMITLWGGSTDYRTGKSMSVTSLDIDSMATFLVVVEGVGQSQFTLFEVFDGQNGEQGLQGLQGPKGDVGIQGPAGKDGVSTYTHIAYATNSTGTTGFSLSDPTGKTYIGMYVDNVATDSTTPSKYKWSLIKGADGSQGIQGPAGVDGKTPYFHVAYALNATGTLGFSTTDSEGKTFIGQYTDFTQADSTDPTKYKWTLIKGADAFTSFLTNDSHVLPANSSGTVSSYAGAETSMLVYLGTADDTANWTFTATPVAGVTGTLSGNKYTITGMTVDTGYVDITASRSGFSSLVKRFALSKSKQGATGSTGSAGQNATSYWLVNSVPAIKKALDGTYTPTSITVSGKSQTGTSSPVAYSGRFVISDSTDGTNFTARYTSSANESSKSYVPTAGIVALRVQLYLAGGTTTLLDEQIVPIVADGQTGPQGPQGVQGPQGIQGVRGADGTTYYTWVKYADSPTTGMSDTPNGKLYMGLAFNKTTATESTNYADYQWSLIKGSDGANGSDGITAVLSNDAHVLPADSAGTVSTFVGAETTMTIFAGVSDDSANWTVSATPTAGVTGTLSGKKYTVTGLSTDTGSITLTASRSGYPSLSRVFTLTKSKQGSAGATGSTGATGPAGQNATAYWLVSSVSAIKKSIAGAYTPTSVTFTGKAKTGTATPVNYSGRFIIAESTDGTNFTTKYTSSADEATKAHSPTAGIVAVRVQFYLAGGTTTLLDEQIVPIVSDGATGATGTKGADGVTYYTWIKYADTETGVGMSDLPEGKRYLGIAYNKSSATESTNPADYSWSPLYDNVKIGGRNFFRNSGFVDTFNSTSLTSKHEDVYAVGWGGYNGGIPNPTTSYHAHIDTATFGLPVYEYNESDGTRNWKAITATLTGLVTQAGEYRLSLDANATLAGTKLFGGFYYTKVGGTTNGFHSGQFDISSTISVGSWGRVDAKVMLNTDVDFTKPITFYIYGYGFTSNAVLYIKKPKLEKGNVSTDWTASPEDVEADLDKVYTQITDLEDLTQPDKIIGTVVFSEDFTSILSDKADVESLNGLATGEELKGVKDDTIKYIDGRIDGEGGVNESINAVTSNLERTANAINAKFTSSGGINLVKNSIGYADMEFWTKTGSVKTIQNKELEQLGFGSGFVSELGSSGYIEQVVTLSPLNPDGTPKKHSLSFWLNKKSDNATNGWAGVDVYDDGNKIAFIGKGQGAGTTNGYELGLFTFETSSSEVTLRLTFGAGTEAIISGLMLNVGEDALQWQHANGEVYNTNIQMNLNGLKVVNGLTKGYTVMSPKEFSGYAEVLDDNNNPVTTRIFTLNGDTTEVTKLDVDLEVKMASVKMIPIDTTTNKGWAFISDI